MYVLAPNVQTLSIEQSDELTVTLIRSGDRDEFSLLYQRYHQKAFRLAFGMTGDREQAADLTQEIFVRVYEGLHSFQGNSSFSTWFYRLALNHCLNHCRKERRRVAIFDKSVLTKRRFQPDRLEAGESLILKQEVQELVRQALLSLKPQDRALLLLKDVEELSYEEIAVRLQCPVGTIGSKICRARKQLARKASRLKGRI